MSRRRKPPSVPAPPEIAEAVRSFARLWPDGPPTKAEIQKAQRNSDEASKRILRAIAIRDGLVRPPWMDNPKDADGPKVRLAKELMDAAFPQGEWRQMGVRAVRKGCEQEAKTRRVQLPSSDSFSRAMGHRRK
jgi:hypothetical protein